MSAPRPDFDLSILAQIRANQRRTPDERLQALGDLLDFVRAIAPRSSEARAARQRIANWRRREREQFVAELRRYVAAQQHEPDGGVSCSR